MNICTDIRVCRWIRLTRWRLDQKDGSITLGSLLEWKKAYLEGGLEQEIAFMDLWLLERFSKTSLPGKDSLQHVWGLMGLILAALARSHLKIPGAEDKNAAERELMQHYMAYVSGMKKAHGEGLWEDLDEQVLSFLEWMMQE